MRKLLQPSLIVCLVSIAFSLSAQENVGIASYYSDSFQGRRTASGELYDKNKLTAAHKTYAYGTYLRVTRLDNKQSVTVKVNDRGPYIRGRIVDLSRKAAAALGIIKDGHANVKIEVVNAPARNESSAATTRPNINIEAPEIVAPPAEAPPVTFNKPTPPPAKPKVVATPKPKVVQTPKPKPASSTTSATFAPGETVVKGKDYKDFDLYKIQLIRPERTGFGVQVASLTNYQNVLKQVAELQEKWFKNILVSVEAGKDGKPVYKTILGPFPDRKTAMSYQKQLKKRKKITGFIVDLQSINYLK